LLDVPSRDAEILVPPVLIPFTKPVFETVAIAVLELDHVA
jgi:hypothetical protein